ncbi:MAG: hypothetical protein ACLUSP_05530 [Christensenellales bacterium]
MKGLVKLGYDLIDARNYTVAACWEFIVPRCGADVPNIDKFVFPKSYGALPSRVLKLRYVCEF